MNTTQLLEQHAAAVTAAAQAFTALADSLQATIGMTANEAAPASSTPCCNCTAADTTPVLVEAVRTILTDKVQQGLTDQVRSLIASFGVSKLVDVPTDKLGDLLTAAKDLDHA